MLTVSNLQQFMNQSSEHVRDKLCRQVSIESPGASIKDCVFSFDVPVPEVPPGGARIRVVCAGACYRMRNRSPSVSSVSSTQSTEDPTHCLSYQGVRDGALFPGYEVAGIVDAVAEDVVDNEYSIKVGERVVIYPYPGIPHGYAEYIVVPNLSYLVKVPDNLSLAVAAMLPSGALLAKNAVVIAHYFAEKLLKERPHDQICRILIVGTGGLALWALRIAEHFFNSPDYKPRVKIVVASLRDEGFRLANELHQVSLVQWNEDCYEKQLIERTKDACNGLVDIVIDFGTTSRSLHRSLQCLNSGGVVLVSEEVAERLLPKFSRFVSERNQSIEAVPIGSIEQLQELVNHVAAGDIIPPPHTEFAPDEAATVVQKLLHSEINGRAILRFHDIL